MSTFTNVGFRSAFSASMVITSAYQNAYIGEWTFVQGVMPFIIIPRYIIILNLNILVCNVALKIE